MCCPRTWVSVCVDTAEPSRAWDALVSTALGTHVRPGAQRVGGQAEATHTWEQQRLPSWGPGAGVGQLYGLSVGSEDQACPFRSPLVRSWSMTLFIFILKHYPGAVFLTLRLKQERELVLTQLSQGLAVELTELVVAEGVRETCSQEFK